MPATERAYLPLVTGTNIEDPSSPGGKTWKETIDTVASQPGYQRCYWGRQVENPGVLEFLVDWDSVEDHKNFVADPVYGPFEKHLLTILDGGATIHHIEFKPHPPSAAVSSTSSPITEMLTLYFLSSVDKSSFEENVHNLEQLMKEHAEGFRSAIGGWVVEEQEHESVDGKAKAYVSASGWDSIEKHQAFRERRDKPPFRDAMQKLGEKAAEMHHVIFQEV